MAKLNRVLQKIFGSNAGVQQIGKFGSMASGNPEYTTNPLEVQSLSNYLVGWFGGVLGGNSPCIEDMNAIHYLITHQLAYILQQGIPEWNSATDYHENSMVNSGGLIYVSIINDNINNPVNDITKWKIYGRYASSTKTANYTATAFDDVLRVDTTSGELTITLPQVSTCIGKKIDIKNIGVNPVIVQAFGAELIDGDNIFLDMNGKGNSFTFFNNGTTWDVL